MEKHYAKSRLIIGILALIISFIMLINETISTKMIVGTFIFMIALIASFLTTPICKQMIKVGDSIANRCLRIIYYVGIIPFILLLAYIFYIIILFVFHNSSGSINAAGIAIFSYTATTIMVIVPYIQALIVLMIRARAKDNEQ